MRRISDEESAYWLAETWKLIEACAASNSPGHFVRLTSLGCAALLEEKKKLTDRMSYAR